MNRRSFAFVIATALLIFWGLPVSAGGNGDLVSVIQTIRGQIVQIVVPVDPQTVSKGTGFWLNDKGLVSTCWHVVAGNPNATIQVLSLIDPIVDFSHHHYSTGMWQPFPAKVVAKDALNDIALLQAEGGPFVVPKARMRMGETELTAHQAVATLKSESPADRSGSCLGRFSARATVSDCTAWDCRGPRVRFAGMATFYCQDFGIDCVQP